MERELGVSLRDVEAAEAETVETGRGPGSSSLSLSGPGPGSSSGTGKPLACLENSESLASGNPDVDINLLKAMDEQRIKSDLAAQEMNLKQQMNELDREPLS